ncbi:MAG: hypothetical protein ACD_75C00965G0002 [uncultured bacterium]|nr:MAG: hypothetical protein ACD_75C00965G0002 [uncultured bacterium]
MKTPSRQQSASFRRVRRISVLAGGGLLFFAMLLTQTGFATAVRAKAFEESEVKAVFLFNLTKFIVWPYEIKESPQAEFAIAILGTDPFGSHLDKVIASESVKGRKIRIRRYQNRQEVQWQEIDLLFIGREAVGDLADLRVAARDSGVLTVGDVGGFCQAGGMVNLLTVENRIRIEVNVEETRKSDFLVSAQMLKLAGIVATGTEEDR